jgi:hypothetical protein
MAALIELTFQSFFELDEALDEVFTAEGERSDISLPGLGLRWWYIHPLYTLLPLPVG